MKDITTNTASVNPAELLETASKLIVWAAKLAQPVTASAPKYITTKVALETYQMGESALKARHIRRVKKGRAWAWFVEDIENCLANGAQPATLKPPKKREITGVNEDPIDAMVRRGELRSVRGGR